MERRLLVAILISFFLIVWVRGVIFLDPDFGWRFRTGQLILTQGIPRTDPYSYTMPSFPFVDHAWLVSVGTGVLYPVIGTLGLAAAAAGIVVLVLIISVSQKMGKDFNFVSIPLLLAASTLLPFVGVRVQVVSWLLLAVLLKVLLDPRLWRKWRFGLPALFILWANLHGGFVVGLVALVLVVTLRAWRKRILDLANVAIVFLSFTAIFINPYGTGLLGEVLSSISDVSIRWTINEWMPTFFFFDLSIIAFIVLSAVLVARQRKQFLPEQLGLFVVFLVFGLASIRNLPLWVIVALPMTIASLKFFRQELKGKRGAFLRFKKAQRLALLGVVLIFLLQTVFSARNAWLLSEDRFYPKGAVEFLKANLPKGQVFSEYGWGGYLIWRLPEKRVFIDGRMPSWRWQAKFASESNSAFDDYNALLTGEIEYAEVFEKFDIDTVLWSSPKPLGFLQILERKLNEVLEGLGRKRRDFDFLGQLEADKWMRVYEDPLAVIYKRPPK